MICFICNSSHSSVLQLCQHLKFFHGLYPGKTLQLKCGEFGCYLPFSTYSGFRKHVLHFHSNAVVDNVMDNLDTEREGEPSTSQAVFRGNIPPPPTQVPPTQVSFEAHVLNMCGSVVAQLQASGVAESTIQAMVGSMEEVVNDIHSQARDAVLKCILENQGSDLDKNVQHCFDQLENPFFFNALLHINCALIEWTPPSSLLFGLIE